MEANEDLVLLLILTERDSGEIKCAGPRCSSCGIDDSWAAVSPTCHLLSNSLDANLWKTRHAVYWIHKNAHFSAFVTKRLHDSPPRAECLRVARVPIFVLSLTLWLLFWLEAVHFLQSIITRYLIISTKNADGGFIFFSVCDWNWDAREWTKTENMAKTFSISVQPSCTGDVIWNQTLGDSIFEFPDHKTCPPRMAFVFHNNSKNTTSLTETILKNIHYNMHFIFFSLLFQGPTFSVFYRLYINKSNWFVKQFLGCQTMISQSGLAKRCVNN